MESLDRSSGMIAVFPGGGLAAVCIVERFAIRSGEPWQGKAKRALRLTWYNRSELWTGRMARGDDYGVVLKMIQVIAFLTSGLPYGALGLGGDLPESKLKALT